jgi:uncharacterized protein (DUF305 family)
MKCSKRNLFVVPIAAATVIVSSGLAISEGNGHAAMDAYMAAHQRMMKQMNMSMSGDPDKDFAMMMIPHHQGAIDMAKVELQYGKDPQLRSMAEEIIKAQEKEIAEMKEWQKAHP